MAQKKSKDTAKVATPEPVAIEERPAEQPVYTPKECIYCLFINDKVVYEQGNPPTIEGKWYVEYLDTRQENTAYGPYQMFDSTGQSLVGFVDINLLKDIARRMWQDNLGNYSITPFPLMSSGNKIMSCMVFD